VTSDEPQGYCSSLFTRHLALFLLCPPPTDGAPINPADPAYAGSERSAPRAEGLFRCTPTVGFIPRLRGYSCSSLWGNCVKLSPGRELAIPFRARAELATRLAALAGNAWPKEPPA
jgi:hypothetical protein